VAQAVRELESVYWANGVTHPVSARSAGVSGAHRRSDRPSVTAVERACDSASAYIDVIDRVLDKGIVIEAWMRMRVGGIDLITVDARVIVASIETYLGYWPALNGAATMAKRRISRDG
jgi:hypothetical protein